MNITQFLDLLSGKSECLFPAPNAPHRTLPTVLCQVHCEVSLTGSPVLHPYPPSFPKALASSASLVAWPLPLLFQVPGMSACTPFISLKGSSSFTLRGFFPDELLPTESDTCPCQSGAADAPRTMWLLFEQLTSFYGYTRLFRLSFGSTNP